MKALKKIAAALSLGVACATAPAMPWTDTISIGEIVPPTQSYTHNLIDDGFRPGLDSITELTLSVTLQDDEIGWANWFDWFEIAVIDPEGSIIPVLWDNWYLSDDIDGTTVASRTWSGSDWTLGFVQDGLFDVTVSAKLLSDDFRLVSSTLTATGTKAVPVPGVAALLGIGLVGVGVASRRKQG